MTNVRTSPAPQVLPYLLAIVSMVLVGTIAVVVVYVVRPNQDNTGLVASILGFIAPTLMALLAFLKSQETHLSVNSRMDEFLKTTREANDIAVAAARTAGMAEGRVIGAAVANTRTDDLARTAPPAAIPTVVEPLLTVGLKTLEVVEDTRAVAKEIKKEIKEVIKP